MRKLMKLKFHLTVKVTHAIILFGDTITYTIEDNISFRCILIRDFEKTIGPRFWKTHINLDFNSYNEADLFRGNWEMLCSFQDPVYLYLYKILIKNYACIIESINN